MADVTRQAVEQIVEALGGKDNISSATHCVTRLRLVLHDDEKVDQEKLESLNLVRGSFSTAGQFQVIIGQGTVEKVYAELLPITGLGEASKDETKQAAQEKQNWLQRGVKMLADIFIPILPAIVTAGLLLGLNNLLVGEGIFFDNQSIIDVYPQWADLADIINLIANAAFTFLPALIGWSAVQRFGGSPLLGIVLGLILVHPDLLNAWAYGDAAEAGEIPVWNLFGLEIEQVGYQGQVLPVLIASFVLAKIENFMKRITPDAIEMLVVAPVALLVTGFLSFILIGPVMFTVGNGITDFFVMMFENFSALGGLLYGLLYAPLVVTGLHHTFLAVDLQLVGSDAIDGTFLWPILALSNIAQGSAAFAIMMATRSENMKGLSFTSGISAWLGVTEPAMFGVNLRYKFPFVCAVIGSAIAATYVSLNNVLAGSIGVGGVPGIFSILPEDWIPFLIGMVIVIIVPFVLTYGYAKLKKQDV
ncbi:PTS system trehalose-specific IIB component (Glc family) /PTS system trehalose-specific IIC component (Glc family) [Salsuginibacillus halophilus]|uniref:PTS system trehalose-specific IIB component (Glc family) /PTS system trehalose-specific IIC component (Glc family) n=1 Tax=Salsuginibacillus halophilus TaxID=517424 RepID=A0A2P8HXE6_9BACI|nr:PTS system trehalose-specific EIIBC component [Salsuginibacillus halophilus]PSL50878.1 PTS system trehalose-specific IIB component (Glc family) /PTS system trehalose-specific IIC component (Glc family) [Salsuginibacillus halophilus]